MKAYICIFVCFSTRAVHIELVSDLTTDAFLGALVRFTNRRGTPAHIYSDNGTNFVGANRELQAVQQLLHQDHVQTALHHFATSHHIHWSFSPSRAPHFGGLWESAVKSAKLLLKKLIGAHKLTFEELYTILTSVESSLNSRPILPLDSTPTDGSCALTPGHFIIG